LRALLARLTPAEREALTRLSIFRAALDDEALEYAGVDAATVTRWLELSLVQREQSAAAPALPPEMAALLDLLPPAERAKLAQAAGRAAERFTVHPVVRDYLLGGLDEAARRDLHTWAAAYYGQPFVDEARRFLKQQTGQEPDPQDVGEMACGRKGVVGVWTSQTQDMAQARGAMARALEWHHHLVQAERYNPAAEITMAVWSVLDRWGERDRAKSLLRGSIATLEGPNRAVAQGNLAALLVDEGKLDAALATYEAVYRTFEEAGSQANMATALAQISVIYRRIGDIDEAIAKQEASLEIKREIGDEEGQAISLHQLAMLYREKGELGEAMARSQAAEALARKLGLEHGVAKCLHEQGLILKRMTPEQAAASLDTEEGPRALAFARFQESLKLSRRIGNEAGAADSLGELGKLLRDAGQYKEAIEAFMEAIEIDRRLGNPVNIAISLEFLGIVHEQQGQFAAALEKFREALALLEKYGSPDQIAIERNHIARVEKRMSG
jgi:tetratricopeptide (TPR) repeat protein